MTKRRRLVPLMLLALPLLPFPGRAGAGADLGPEARRLAGTWRVDLRSKPADPPYYRDFVVKEVKGTTFSGTFYESEVTDSQINADWGVVHLAFTTTDARGRGIYHTSARLVSENRIEGTTHSLGRKFLSVWTAERKAP